MATPRRWWPHPARPRRGLRGHLAQRGRIERAAQHRDRLALRPTFSVAATDTFMRKNTNRSVDERLEEMPSWRSATRPCMDWLDVA